METRTGRIRGVIVDPTSDSLHCRTLRTTGSLLGPGRGSGPKCPYSWFGPRTLRRLTVFISRRCLPRGFTRKGRRLSVSVGSTTKGALGSGGPLHLPVPIRGPEETVLTPTPPSRIQRTDPDSRPLLPRTKKNYISISLRRMDVSVVSCLGSGVIPRSVYR